MKKYFYEILGFLCFYIVAKHLLDVNLYLSIGLGLMGTLLGRFLYKYNGVFFDKIESISQRQLTDNEAEFQIVFSIHYKRKPYDFKGTFITVQTFETEKLRLFLYNHFTENIFIEVMKFGKSNLKFKDYNHPFNFTILLK